MFSVTYLSLWGDSPLLATKRETAAAALPPLQESAAVASGGGREG